MLACVQETKWIGTKARDVEGFKLWYLGSLMGKNGVDILVQRGEQVMEIRRANERIMVNKLVFGGLTFNVTSAYVQQAGLDEEVKRCFQAEVGRGCERYPAYQETYFR